MVMAKQPFNLVVVPQFEGHLSAIESKYHSTIRDKIAELLLHEPDTKTRNRKPLRSPILGATWEIRFGPDNRFRVFYDVEVESQRVILIGIGVKIRDQLYIGGEEYES
jgi:hypothetical protein